MKLTDENGNTYEFEEIPGQDIKTPLQIGTLKPIEKEWPQEGDEYWYIDEYGEIDYTTYDGHLDDTDRLFGIYRTKEEAEMAAEFLADEFRKAGFEPYHTMKLGFWSNITYHLRHLTKKVNLWQNKIRRGKDV